MRNLAVIEQLSQLDFFKKTVEQVKRDFSRVGIELRVSEDVSNSEALAEAIRLELDAVLEQRPDMFAHLLYIIDLPESKVRELIASSEYTARDIALPIIYRAAEKVYYRIKFG